MKAKLFVVTLRVRTTYMGSPQTTDRFIGVYRVRPGDNPDQAVSNASSGKWFHRMTVARRIEHIQECLGREGYTRVDTEQVMAESSY